ncbi:MAG: protein-L-isoaspartate(D-aspartate) O-methyltransferase [Desulfohalobiaceae bacterium]
MVYQAVAAGQVPDLRLRRRNMLRDQLQARGIEDELVLEAMGRVKRHLFVEEALQSQAYSDHALPIGYGQTISQPFSVAMMSSCLQLQPGMKVLEVGAGSGYQAAVLAEMGALVYSVECIKPLYQAALQRLTSLRYFRVKLKLADGSTGWPEEAPFDRILVSAGGPRVPQALLQQLADAGLLLMPVGKGRQDQDLIRVRRQGEKFFKQELGRAKFVELVGEHGWK